MFMQEFTKAGLLTRVIVSRETAGWRLREERDGGIVREANYHDWHRLERALQSIEARFQTADLPPVSQHS